MTNNEYNEINFKKNYKKIVDSFLEIKVSNKFYESSLKDIPIIHNYSDFCKIPLLTKKVFSENSKFFFEKVCNTNCERYTTSGTSGNPLKVIRTKSEDVIQNLVLNLYRTKNCKKIIGQKGLHFLFFYKDGFETNLFEVLKYNRNFNRFQYFIINDEVLKSSLEYINYYHPVWIVGSSSFILKLAQYQLEHKILDFQVDYIECNSEFLSTYSKEIIFDAFKVLPTCVYGSNEHNAIAYQCKYGNMHVIEENVFLEIMDNKSVIITSLINKKTGLLRYEQGDLAEWDLKKCNCGFMGPIIKLTGFRKNDYITYKDNTIDMWFFHGLVKKLQSKFSVIIDQYKVVQERNIINISLIVKNPTFFPYKREIIESIKSQFYKIFDDNLLVNVDFVDVLEVDKVVGKFRFFEKK